MFDMKFDIVVGNPPYGIGTQYTHLKIMKTVLPLCTDKLCFIMPSKPITQQLDKEGVWYKMFKEAVCTDIQTVSKSMFPTTVMDNTAIYYCDRKIKDFEKYCKKLDVENVLYSAVSDEGRLFIDGFHKYYNDGHKCIKPFIEWDRRKKDIYQSLIEPDNYYLSINLQYGPLGGKWISKKLQQIDILDSENEKEDLRVRTAQISILKCPTKEYGENLKNLMINGKVLRYSLWLKQVNQNIIQEQYKYVPALDYTEIDTDEKLLSTCGFSNDEIIKILNYLKDFDFSQNRNELIRGIKYIPDEDQKEK